MSDSVRELKLTPSERRAVVIVFLGVIIVLNWMFVWPHFGDWASMNKELKDMRDTEFKYNRVIAQDRDPVNGWALQVKKLASLEGGGPIELAVDPQLQFQNTIRVQEKKTGVFVGSINPGTVKTNEFFEEHTTSISVECKEPQLVSFLYNMGNDPAMIRVSKLDLKPADANRYSLKGSLTLTANYSKKSAQTQIASAQAKPVASPKPAAAPATKPPADKPSVRSPKRPQGSPPPPADKSKSLPAHKPASGRNDPAPH
jgi:hypothetical protein